MDAPLKALVFDSFYDSYQGVVVYIRLLDGRVRAGQRILHMSSGKIYEVQQVGVFSPTCGRWTSCRRARSATSPPPSSAWPTPRWARPSPTRCAPLPRPSPAIATPSPWSSPGSIPSRTPTTRALRDALEKLRLNDSAFNFEPETSLALGYGFRCGFLGMLHLEIVQERLEREFNLSLIVTAPSVRYKVITTQGETLEVENPSQLPPPDKIERMEEPYVRGSVYVPTEFMSEIYKLAQDKRGEHQSLEYVGKRVHILFDFPLAEIVVDFYDKLKSISKGYASFDYEFLDFRESELVKLDILLNGDPVDALSHHRPSGQGIREGQDARREAPRGHPPAALRGGHPGRHRQPGHRPRDRQGHGQERHRQVLRRRHLAQAQAPGETERRQEAHEAGRQGRGTTRGVPVGAQELTR